ncbi:hypothetical protein [Belnapia moabensis]|uniref:hypothetical protein n=1 Tax=Belnapia moabensis TaxID=365533 RepID=UPI0005BB04E6|nr:hypothetical protein [Belnapia moabensis]
MSEPDGTVDHTTAVRMHTRADELADQLADKLPAEVLASVRTLMHPMVGTAALDGVNEAEAIGGLVNTAVQEAVAGTKKP